MKIGVFCSGLRRRVAVYVFISVSEERIAYIVTVEVSEVGIWLGRK